MSFWKDRKVVVTGAAGLVGSHLCDLLVEENARVVAVDDLSKGTRDQLDHLNGRITFIQVDLRDESTLSKVFHGQEVVMHLASRAYGIAYSQNHHSEMLSFNRDLNSKVLNACVKYHIPRICVVSSSCVYPNDTPSPTPELPVMTGDPETANSGYGWAKRFLEIEAQKLAKDHGIEVAIVRPFNAYSGRYKWEGINSHVIPMLVKKILDGNHPVVVWGSGQQRRNFLHAVDFARCFMAVTEHHAIADPVNVGYEDTVSMWELVTLMSEVLERKVEIIFDVSKPEGRMIKSADSTKLRRVTGGILPSISLRDGLREMRDWYDRSFGDKEKPS